MKNIVMPTPSPAHLMRRAFGVSTLIATLFLAAEVGANCTLIPGNVARTPDTNFTVDDANGTVTDSVTGLIWKKCVEGLSGTTCTGTATPLTWSEALERAASDATFADWRLPTKNQLLSLLETACRSPAINKTFFPNTLPNLYWSSTPATDSGGSAWLVDFSGDNATRMGIDDKTAAHLVRLVRSQVADDTYNLATPAVNHFSLSNSTPAIPAAGAALNTVYTSTTIPISGLATAGTTANVKITGGTYQKNALAYTAANGTVVNGDTIKVQQTSSASRNTRTLATLTIGGVSRNYSITTAP